ncbi:MAG: hypothetical protein Q8O94_02795 [bacterium]|nr:hypothetical protein [bacterium]
MALRSGSNNVAFWGAYVTASLPVNAEIEVGDQAYDLTTGLFQVCSSIGPVVWAPIAGQHAMDGAFHTAAPSLSSMLSLLGVSAGLLECIVNSTPLVVADPDDILDFAITGASYPMLVFAGFCSNDGASAATINLRLNGAAAAGTNRRLSITATSAIAGAAGGTCLLGFPLNATACSWITFLLPCAANSISRWAITISGGVNSGPISALRIEVYEITTPTAATEITSIGFDSSIANGLGVGTRAWIWGLTV